MEAACSILRPVTTAHERIALSRRREPLFIIMIGTAIPAWLGDVQAVGLLALEGAALAVVDKWFDGPILIHFGHDNGLLPADLVGSAAVFVAAVYVLRSRIPERSH